MKPQPHFLTICWDATAEDGTPVTLQATLCKTHRQVIALRSASARGVRRQFGESCDMCHGREPRRMTTLSSYGPPAGEVRNLVRVCARQAINQRLNRFIGRGRADRSIHAAVNATEIIVFSAMLTKPLPYGPDWRRIAERQIAIFVNGLATSGPSDIPGPGVKREDIEKAFAHASLISGKQSEG